MGTDIEREIPLSQEADGMLARLVRRVVDGVAEPTEVTSALQRVCDESRHRPPEILVIRIKELWTKIAGAPRHARDEKDRRYLALIGEALVLYFGPSPSDFISRRPPPAHEGMRAESESDTLRRLVPRHPLHDLTQDADPHRSRV